MIIAPALTSADPAQLAKEIGRVNRAKADWVHFDIMDGHFVPRLSVGPGTIRALRRLSRLFFDVHLLCDRPEPLIGQFAAAGADGLTIHAELGAAVVTDAIWRIRAAGKSAGLALNPGTSVSLIEALIAKVDLVLVLTANPGLGPECFIHEALPKVQQLSQWRAEGGFGFRIGVDGAVEPGTAREAALAGAEVFVTGDGVFGAHNLAASLRRLRRSVRIAGAQCGTAAEENELLDHA